MDTLGLLILTLLLGSHTALWVKLSAVAQQLKDHCKDRDKEGTDHV